MPARRFVLPLVVCIAGVSAVAIGGCRPEKPDVVEAQRAEAASRAESARAAAKDGKAAVAKLATPRGMSPETAARVLATVGESTITVADVERFIAAQPRHQRARYTNPEQRRALLERMIDMEVLALEARKRGLDADPTVQHVLKDALARQLLETAVDTTVSLSEISDAQIKAFYDANPDRYVRPEARRAAIIAQPTRVELDTLRATIDTAIAETPAQARQIFGDFAKARSIQKESAHLKGDLGFFDAKGQNDKGQSRVSAPTAAAVFALKTVNQIGPAFEADGGRWSLVQLTHIREAASQPLEAVRLDIQTELLLQRKTAERERFIAELRARATVTIDESKLDSLKAPAPDPAAGQFKMPQIRRPSAAGQRALRPDKRRAVPVQANPEVQKKAEEIAEEIRRKKEEGQRALEESQSGGAP